MSVLTPTKTFTNTEYTWLLPDGVADLMADEAIKQEALRYQLTQILLSYGYELISPPIIEYTESLLNHASEDLKRQTFKIIDQLTGRLMGVRADITPQIARIDAHMCEADKIARYCYTGHVIYTLPKGLFGSRTPLQLGAEIFGSESIDADIELLDVLFTLLSSTDLVNDCHIDIGHVSIFRTLCQLANLSIDLQEKLMELYRNKALPELKQVCQYLAETGCEFANDFYVLVEAGNDLSKLNQQLSAKVKQHPIIQQALTDLSTLATYLQTTWQCNISVDVTELQGYHYYQGMIFNVFINNESLPIIWGGRYINPHSPQDTIRSGTGFSCDLTRWQNHIATKKRNLTLVPFTTANTILKNPHHADYKELQQTIERLRQQGEAVIIPLSEQDNPRHVTHILVKQQHQWEQQII